MILRTGVYRVLALTVVALLVMAPAASAAETAVMKTGRTLVFESREEVAEGWLLFTADGGHVLITREMIDHFAPSPSMAEDPTGEAGGVTGDGESAGQETLRETVARIAEEFSVDPLLVEAVIEVESSFDPFAVSPRGAAGLMQLMPGTARELEVPDVFDPAANIRGGVRYLRDLELRFGGDLGLALAAYNAGAGAVQRHGGIPPYRETRDYVIRVLRRYLAASDLALHGGSGGKS